MLIETLAEPDRQFDCLFVSHQADRVPRTIVDCRAVAAVPKVLVDSRPHLRREISLHVVNEYSSNFRTLNFFDLWVVRDHKVTLLLEGEMLHSAKSDKTHCLKPS